ncbi:MAG: peptidase U34, partial [Chloroflexi bacterium]
MCDTLVAVGDATLDGAVILAKNSDRQPNEAQVLAHFAGARHEAGANVRCTHVSIPQVAETYEVLLSRPFWTWGCEMGVNAPGVAIGNEAVFTKEPYEKGPGLLGMDLARLALERAGTAQRALETIVELLETYGQGGNHGYPKPEYYHNSFLIADPHEAWVLETAGGYWAADRVRGVRTISNGLTIGREWELAGPGLREHAVERKWVGGSRGPEEVAFDRCYSDALYTSLDGCRTRQRRSTALLEGQRGQITVATAMAALRDHGSRAAAGESWNPDQGLTMDTLCVHASLGPLRPAQTAGAMVAHLAPDLVTCWLTGTAATCTGIFKPVYLDGAGLPDLGPEPDGAYDGASLWWAHERLHRAVFSDYGTRMPVYQAKRDALEA